MAARGLRGAGPSQPPLAPAFLPAGRIGIGRGKPSQPEVVEAVARHICESLDNITVPAAEEAGGYDFAALAFARMKRARPGQVLPGW